MILYSISGTEWKIDDACFAKGGEGELHNVTDRDEYVVKLYKDGVLTPARQEKLIYMSSLYSRDRLQQLSWPRTILEDSQRNIKGFAMRKFPATKDMADLLDGTSNNPSDNLDWLKRIVTALNLAHLVNEIHSLDQIIGDMNPKNFGVDMSNGFVCAFDTDSFHLRDKSTGKWYPCTVLDEHYIAPELQSRLNQGGRVDSFRPEETFTRETDNFALAVLIFQLLFNGTHPFTAARVPSRGSSVVIHTRETNIYQKMSPFFNPAPNTTIPVYAPPLSIVPESMQELFRRAFLQDIRPTAQEWAAELSALVLQVEKCQHGHYFGRYNTQCPWCAMKKNVSQPQSAISSKPLGNGSSVTYSTPASFQKKKRGWLIAAAIVSALILVTFIVSYIANSTGNPRYISQESVSDAPHITQTAASNDIQVVKNTESPLTPTAKPMAFDPYFAVGNGIVRISWSESEWKGPYTVHYQYINHDSSVQQEKHLLGTTDNTYIDCPYFIPGREHLIILSDSHSTISTIFTCPSTNVFSDSDLKASSIDLSIIPKKFIPVVSTDNEIMGWYSTDYEYYSDTMNETYSSSLNYYGYLMKITYPPVIQARKYNALLEIDSPNGYLYTDSFDMICKYSKAEYKEEDGLDYFKHLYRTFSGFPIGEYTVKLFFDGQYVCSRKFIINKGEGGKPDSTNKQTSQKASQINPVKSALGFSSTTYNGSMKFDSQFKVSNGIARISWSESEQKGPYSILYQYMDSSSDVEQEIFLLGTTNDTYIDCKDFVPGGQYKIFLSDSHSTISTIYTHPFAGTFSDDDIEASSINISITPKFLFAYYTNNGTGYSILECKTYHSADIVSYLSSTLSRFGYAMNFIYPSTEQQKKYQVLTELVAPNGYVYTSSFVLIEPNTELVGGWEYFEHLHKTFGDIPVGKHKIRFYFNGQYVCTQSFIVNKGSALEE